KQEREAAIAMLWRKQQPDGGWSTRRMSDLLKWRVEVHPPTQSRPWKEAMDPTVVKLIQNLPDAANPGSDPYMTAFAIVLLRESSVSASDPRIQRGIVWLKETQRVSGRWWMDSLYRGNYNYITYISTATARSVIILWMAGGVTHLDSFDPKPEAPDTIRGALTAIQTTIPGVQFCETLPQLARQAQHLAVVRSFSHDSNDHFLSQAYAL